MALSCRARGEYAGAGCLSYHQAAGGTPAACLRGQLDLTSSHKDCPRHAAARCGRGCPEVFCKTSRRVLTEGSIIARDAPAHSDTGSCHGTWSGPLQPTWEERTMTDEAKTQDWSGAFWYRGKVTRRRLIGYGTAAGALGATMLVPAPWQAAFGQAKPYKIG